ncbi:MAG: hypothetical protein AAGD32_07450 [Planctomycetota bacterium]
MVVAALLTLVLIAPVPLHPADEPTMQYILHVPPGDAPDDGWGVVFVLPGGDGSADFAPFVKNIAANAVPNDCLTVQLIATPLNPGDNTVWPTEFLLPREPERQAFTVEQHIAEARAAIAAEHALDDAREFVFGWSSGGPACYALLLDEDLGIDGALIAMSVFYPGWHQPIDRVDGKALYLLHSPQDQVCRINLARNAERMLGDAGATVEFQTYNGGHGWHGDIFGNIAAGLSWLDEQAD